MRRSSYVHTSPSLPRSYRNSRTFLRQTERDFADVASAGLNFVRIPIPYWAIAKFDDEPFLSGAQWKYVVKAIGWARKYGLRINLDLHAHPGSQNGCVFAGISLLASPTSADYLLNLFTRIPIGSITPVCSTQ